MTTTITYSQKKTPTNQLKNNHKSFVYSMAMLGFEEKKIAKEKFYAEKKLIKIWLKIS